jgi:type I site-specific restriction endonuclease
MPTPEQLAREKIDSQLAACGWIVQDRAGVHTGSQTTRMPKSPM